jgi:Carboxypeptidase regulatory-like domain/TonB dependent receptor
MITLLKLSRGARIIAGLAFTGTLLFGQGIDSILVGTVTDPSGAAIPASQVVATNRDTGVHYSAATNGTGEYRIDHLPVGSYDVAAAAPSFAPRTLANVPLQLNRTAVANIRLELTAQAVSVQVTEAAAPIDAGSSQLQATFDTRALIDVPAASSGSGFLNLSLLTGGVASSGAVGQGVGPSVAGQRPSGNRFYVEGVDNNSYFTTGPLTSVSNEALSEFTVLQNYYGSQFGGAPGGVFDTVVKSGGNQIHGSLYEYMQNRNLDALDAAYARQGATSPPRYDNNRLGATFGGPIVKNKLFYFGSFEYNPVGYAFSPAATVYAPTAAGFQMLNSLPGLNQVNLGVLEKYTPAATGPVQFPTQVQNASIPIGALSIIAPSYINTYRAAGSIDWDLSDRDRVRGRYLYTKYSGIDTKNAELPAFFATVPDNTHLVSLSEYHTFSATTINEFRAAYSRNDQRRSTPNLSFPGLDSFPTLYFDDTGLQIGPNWNYPYGQVQDELQLSDSITRTVHRHTLTAGYDFRDIILSTSFVSYPRGFYEYSSLQQYLLDLTPDSFGTRFLGTTGPLVNGMPAGFLQNAAYVQDDFRIRPNLTLNLGVRYEYVTVPVLSRAQQYSALADVPGIITFQQPKPSANDWSPRVGFAYSPGKSGLWAIRGGFSRSFDTPYANLAANTAPAFYGSAVNVNVNSNAPGFLANGGLNGTSGALSTPAAARAATTGYTSDQVLPYALTYTITLSKRAIPAPAAFT